MKHRTSFARPIWTAAPLLAAAAVLLLVRARPWNPAPAHRSVPSSEASGDVPPPIDLHFKGGLAGVVIRERDGQQERIAGPVRVRAGDRIRLAISTDRGQAMAAGLLMDDGSWSPLMTATWLDAGTHYSERAARFDDGPTHATLVVGPPDAVQRARASRDFAGLLTWTVTSEP